jgi:RNA polymerase sigma-70 factor (ECF subfamily)
MERAQFEILARRIRPRLLLVAKSILTNAAGISDVDEEAEDMTQEALLRLWVIRDKIDDYKSPDILVVTIVKNLCISKLRKWSKFRVVDNDLISHNTPQMVIEENENDIWLRNAIENLPPGQTAILRMKQNEGMSIKDIADTLAMNETAVRQQLSRARKRLLEQIKNRR